MEESMSDSLKTLITELKSTMRVKQDQLRAIDHGRLYIQNCIHPERRPETEKNILKVEQVKNF